MRLQLNNPCDYDANLERRAAIINDFSIPILPKCGIFLNLNGAMATSIGIIVLALSNRLSGNNYIYNFSYLIPAFVSGFVVGILSVIFGFFSVYVLEFKIDFFKKFRFIDQYLNSEKFWFIFSVSLMIISNLIFIFSILFGIYILMA